MSGTEPRQSRSGEKFDDDGYRIEERAESEEYHQTKEVREEEDRTEIHVREGKVVKMEEVKTKETIRLASEDELRALTLADFEGLDEIEAGTEVTVEEFSRKESRHEKTVDGEPVVEISLTEERRSEEVKEDPQWKKDMGLIPDLENGDDANASIQFDPGLAEELVALEAQAPSVKVPEVVVSSTCGELSVSASRSADADLSVLSEPKEVEVETSIRGKPKGLNGMFGKKKAGKEKNKGKQSAAAVETEMETDDVEKENEVYDLSSSRRHEVKHKRHIIEEVVIEDSDKFYEKQEKRPRLFLKGNLERKKESPLETSHEATASETGSVGLKPPDQSLHAESLPNISSESVTYVVDYDQRASSSMEMEGHGDKPLSEYKWYSFPRKHVKGKTTESESPSLQRQPETKSQDEIVIFDGQEVDKTERKWGLKFRKWPGQTMPIPETVSTEQITFVVENEPPSVAAPAAHDLPLASTETHTFIVEGDQPKPKVSGLPRPEKITAKKEHTVKAGVEPETVTFVVEQGLPRKDIDLDKDKEHSLRLLGKIGGPRHEKDTSKTSLEGETITYVVQTELPKGGIELDKDKEHSWGLFGKIGAQPSDKDTNKTIGQQETVTYVVEEDWPKEKAKLPKGKEHSWSLLGKTGGLQSEEDTSKPSVELETVRFVVEQDLPKADVKLSKEKEHSWSLLGKLGKETSKPDDSHMQVDTGARPKRQEVLIDEPHYYAEKNPLGKKGAAELQLKGSLPVQESLTITVQAEEDPVKAHLSDDDKTDKKAWSLKWPTGEKKEKKEKKHKFQDEVIVDDTHLHMDEEKIKGKPAFGKLVKDSARAEIGASAELDAGESITFVVNEETSGAVRAEAPSPGASGKILPSRKHDKPQLEGEESITFIVEGKRPEANLELDGEKSGSWYPFGKVRSKKHATSDNVEPETVTFVVEQDLPKAKGELDKKKEHSLSFPGKFGSRLPEKDTSKPDVGSESVTFVSKQEVPTVETEADEEKHRPVGRFGNIEGSLPEKHASKASLEPETVTFIVEQDMPEAKKELDKDKEHSLGLLGKLGSLFPEKTNSKTSLEPESVTFVVEGGEPHTSGEGRKRKQEERITDDTHLFFDDANIKVKPPKITDIVRKKELTTATQAETITFVVTGEPEVAEDLPNVSLSANGDESKAIGQTQEPVTFIVSEDRPTGEIKTDATDRKAKTEKSWKIHGFGFPSMGKSKGGNVETNAGETVTFVVQNTGSDDAARSDDSQREGHVLFDKKVELKPVSGKISAGFNQEEVVVDDTHLYAEKTEVHWSPFAKAGGKSGTGARMSAGVEQPQVKLTAEAGPTVVPETVTYTVTTDVAAPDLDSSSATDKSKGGKPHKWKIFGKKSSKGSEKSGSSGSLPSLGSKDASLPRRQRQEEVVVGGDSDYVPDNRGIITSGKGKSGKKVDTAVYTFKVEPGLATKSVEIPKVQAQQELQVAVPDLHAEIQTTEPPLSVSSEAGKKASKPVIELKFDLGDVKAVENVKQEYMEAPEPKKIVLGVDYLNRTLKYHDSARTDPQINGIEDVRSAEHVESSDRPSDVSEKRIAINFETSTPKKDVSTGAHGDEIRGPGSDHPFDVTVSSDTSISFAPQVSGGGLDGSFDESSVTGSRPSSFYSVPATAGGGSGSPSSQHFVVVAIDFGTTFSGYAFSFSRDINSIHVMRKWPDGDPGVVNMKTPTVLLLTPEGKFHSFGFTAKDFFHNLNPKEATKWFYFEKFKMALHYSADLSTGTELETSNGRRFPALTVFSHALRFFRDHALREVSDQSATRILNEDVRWVITVPAIWKAPAKQFMRQAAYQAGIASADNPDQLLVALEPEAASIFIRKQRLQQLIPESELSAERSVSPVSKRETTPEPVLIDRVSQLYAKQDTYRLSQTLPADALSLSFQRAPSPIYAQVRVGEDLDLIGMRYMVADCGGGTVDITVYELSAETGKLAELYKATGGPYGSMGVDLEFEALLVEIFGADFIDVFKAKRPAGWVDLMMAFESRKRAATPFKSKPLNVSLPFSFMDYHKKYRSSTVESAIRKYNNKDVRWSSQGMMRLMPEAMDQLFKPTLNKIKEAIGNVFNNPDVKGIKYIFLVGGFAESPMLQLEIRNEFSHLVKILIPADASLAILKGAVCFGCDPGVVTVRKSRMSYGLSVLNKFVRGRHPESKLGYKDGVEWCVDVFDPLVLANQSVALGSSVVRCYTPAGSGQKFGNFEMYCSERDDVQFITDPGVEKEIRGQLRLDLSELDHTATGGKRREVQARMTFGDTEIKVVALDVATGNSVRATIDFLNK